MKERFNAAYLEGGKDSISNETAEESKKGVHKNETAEKKQIQNSPLFNVDMEASAVGIAILRNLSGRISKSVVDTR